MGLLGDERFPAGLGCGQSLIGLGGQLVTTRHCARLPNDGCNSCFVCVWLNVECVAWE